MVGRIPSPKAIRLGVQGCGHSPRSPLRDHAPNTPPPKASSWSHAGFKGLKGREAFRDCQNWTAPQGNEPAARRTPVSSVDNFFVHHGMWVAMVMGGDHKSHRDKVSVKACFSEGGLPQASPVSVFSLPPGPLRGHSYGGGYTLLPTASAPPPLTSAAAGKRSSRGRSWLPRGGCPRLPRCLPGPRAERHRLPRSPQIAEAWS